MGRKNHGYEIYKKYSVEDIFKELENNTLPDRVIYGESDYKDSLRRVQIIKNLIDRDGNKCVRCGIKLNYFALGKDKIGRWHLDLYSDKDHMFTIDHIHPKSKGGENVLDNYQLLCKICNEDKSDSVDGEESTQKINVKKHYIDKKLTSLSEQVKGVFFKIKTKKIVCIKEEQGFTIGNEYDVLDIKMKINKKFGVKYQFTTTNDNGKNVDSSVSNFITLLDYISIKSIKH